MSPLALSYLIFIKELGKISFSLFILNLLLDPAFIEKLEEIGTKNQEESKHRNNNFLQENKNMTYSEAYKKLTSVIQNESGDDFDEFSASKRRMNRIFLNFLKKPEEASLCIANKNANNDQSRASSGSNSKIINHENHVEGHKKIRTSGFLEMKRVEESESIGNIATTNKLNLGFEKKIEEDGSISKGNHNKQPVEGRQMRKRSSKYLRSRRSLIFSRNRLR